MIANKERMLQRMEEFNLDVLIASFPENVAYLSEIQSHRTAMYRFWDVESFSLFAKSPDIAPALIISKGDVSWPVRYPRWIKEIYTFGNTYYPDIPGETFSEEEWRFKRIMDDQGKHARAAGEAIVKALKQKGLDKGRIGLDERILSPATREKIKEGLPHATLLDAFELFRIIRMVKTPEELERIRTVGLLNERAVQSTIQRLAPGVTEDELTQHFLECLAKEGAVLEFWNTASGPYASMNTMAYGHVHPASGYRLKQGDIFRFDGGSIYNQYHSDAGGCTVLGTPNQRQRAAYRAIEAGIERAMELLKPGVLPSKIFEETVATVEKAGIKEYSEFSDFCGHGIGIEPRDYPLFRKPVKATSPFLPGTYDVPVEEGMVVCIEVPYREMGLGIQVEYTLLVKKDGCEKLFPHTRGWNY
jgi:Xaa-Pro dipeptidase